MMVIIDALIGFLTELKGQSQIGRFLTLAGIPGVILAVVGVPIWLMTRRVKEAVTAYDSVVAQLQTARGVAAKLQAEVDRLQAETPAAFIDRHGREMAGHNDERAMGLAAAFLDRQRDALLLAFRTRIDEAVRESVDDGAPAFARAGQWAQAALALAPGDGVLRMQIEEFAAAEVAAAAGALARPMSDADRRARAAQRDGLPTNLAALTDAFFDARARGHYQVMLFLAGHGLALTRRLPQGEGTRDHLLFRRHRAEALRLAGQAGAALAALTPLVADFTRVFGPRAPETLYARSLRASCLQATGDAAGALREIGEWLPTRIEVLGERHRDVLATRYLRADCLRDTGDAAGALREIGEWLPTQIEVLGERDRDVLATRYLRADCLQATGDAAGALREIAEWLPTQIEVHGARHPSVLATRYLRAQCLRATGDAAGALREIAEWQPTLIEVLGERHPDVLTTRHLRAYCLQATGDAAGALREIAEWLPTMIEVLTARHPDVLRSRILLADLLVDVGARADAEAALEGVRDGLVAAELRPEHRYFEALDAVEQRLRGG